MRIIFYSNAETKSYLFFSKGLKIQTTIVCGTECSTLNPATFIKTTPIISVEEERRGSRRRRC
jgi:hypothetical protein